MITAERTPVEELRIVAKTRIFRHAPEVVDSINWLNSNKAELSERMNSFAEVNGELNGIMSSKAPLSDSLRDIRRLQSLLSGVPIPSLERVQSDFYTSPVVKKHLEDLFETAKLEYPSWAKINSEYPSRGAPAMGAFIEGFGSYLGKLAGSPEKAKEINRTYVLAFEELLITKFPSSSILKDAIGWMVEEKNSFPPEIQKLIEEKAIEFRSK